MAPAYGRGLSFYSTVYLFQTQPLSTGAGRAGFCGEDYACLLMFCKNSVAVVGMICHDWGCTKHPVDVAFKKSSWHVKHTRCPHAMKIFLKKCCALFVHPPCHNSTSSAATSDSLPKHQTQAYHRKSSGTEPAGKALNVVKEKTAENKEALSSKLVNFFR